MEEIMINAGNSIKFTGMMKTDFHRESIGTYVIVSVHSSHSMSTYPTLVSQPVSKSLFSGNFLRLE